MIGSSFSKSIIDSFQKGFVYECYEILVAGHLKLLELPNFSVDWQETDITSQFVICMRNLRITNRYRIDLVTEFQLNTEINHSGDAKKNSRIDIRMMNWSEKEKKAFYIEAKNLCDINWKKSSGTRVNCEKLAEEYINEGVKRFVSEKYPYGCMVGYILKGDPDSTVKKINQYVEADSFVGKLTSKHTLFDHPYFYDSENIAEQKSMVIKHLFFPFSTN